MKTVCQVSQDGVSFDCKKKVIILLLGHLDSTGIGLDLKATLRNELDSYVYCLVRHYAWCKMAF